MNIIIGKTSGFCAGVKNSIAMTNKALDESNGEVCCLGELIHNKQVVKDLENKGLKIIDSIDEATDKVIIRAHGITKDVYEVAEQRGIQIIDLTCPRVLRIHKQVEAFSNDDYFIFLFGIKDHPEIVGTASFCGECSYVLESPDDIPYAINAFQSSGLRDILIISQTTFSLRLFDEMVDEILDYFDGCYHVQIEKSICQATSSRQMETKELSKEVDLMIIIGGKNSSNTKKLYEVALENCKNAIHIETKDDLNLDFVKSFENIGIMAGASTPEYIVNDVYNALTQ